VLPDKYLPAFHFNEKHSIEINASPSTVSAQIAELNVSDSLIIRMLLALRGIPRKTSTGMEGWKKMGFVVLEHQPDKEIILGLIGQFWKANGNIQTFLPDDFITAINPAFVKAVWNFKISPLNENRVLLETETRIFCPGDRVRRKFSRYWFFIKPFSGLIRKEMLKIIKRKAERVS
jgi:hypothetical protein